MPPPRRAAASRGLDYRPAVPADEPFLILLYAAARDHELAATDWPDALKRTFIAQQHRAREAQYAARFPDAERLIVVHGRRDVGRLVIDSADDRLHLVDIALVPEARGAGLGAAILADLLSMAKAAGQTVTLSVEPASPARRLYERMGFRPRGEASVYLTMEWRGDRDSDQ